MLKTKVAFATIGAMLALAVGCGPKSPSDQTIITDIQSKLYADTVTKPASIAVTVQNGVVTLAGNVDSSDVALEAMKIANGTQGVKGVNDSMTINGTAASNQVPNAGNPAPAEPSVPVAAPPSSAASSPQPPNPPVAPPPPPAAAETLTVPAGEHIQVRTVDPISSKTADPDQVYRATLDAPLVHEGRVVIPAGAPVSLVVVASRSAGRIAGKAELELRASRIRYQGRSYPIDSGVFEEEGKGRGRQTAVRTGIGAVAGAVIGGIAGGGKGAAIGSAAGGGAGFGTDLFTHGQQVNIPSESLLTFRLEAPLTVERR